MKLVGLTGGIGSGKSTVSAYLAKKGVALFDADEVSRNAVKKGSACLQKVIELLGEEYLLPDGELNRKKVAERVFADKSFLPVYAKIIQDEVLRQAMEFVAEEKKKAAKIAVLDVPLLIECDWHKKTDEVWLVKVEPEVQVQRTMARDNMTREEVEARIANQMPLADKMKYADKIIDNGNSAEETYRQIDALLAVNNNNKQ